MQKFPIDSHSNENFISPFFHPLGAANPKRVEDTSGTTVRPHANYGVNRPAGCREIVNRTKKTYSKTNTSPFALTSEWRVIKRVLYSASSRSASNPLPLPVRRRLSPQSYSRTSANTARPRIRASESCHMPIYSPSFCRVLILA